MNKETKPEAGNTENASHAASTEMAQLMQIVKDYAVPVGGGILVALVLVIGFGLYKSGKAAKAEKAAAALMQAASLEDIQRVTQEYKNTPTGPAALLGLANNYLQSGQFMMAQTTYDQFISDYPKHILKPSAELGKAYCLEAEGNLDEALTAYQAFVEKYPDYFLVPQAILSQGRCLEQLGQFDASKIVYEDFMVQYPESRWIPHAKTALLYVEKARRAKEKGLEPRKAPAFGMQAPGFGTLPALESQEAIVTDPAQETAQMELTETMEAAKPEEPEESVETVTETIEVTAQETTENPETDTAPNAPEETTPDAP